MHPFEGQIQNGREGGKKPQKKNQKQKNRQKRWDDLHSWQQLMEEPPKFDVAKQGQKDKKKKMMGIMHS